MYIWVSTILHLAPWPTELYKNILSEKLFIFSYPSVLTYVLSSQKNRLIETILKGAQNIYFC